MIVNGISALTTFQFARDYAETTNSYEMRVHSSISIGVTLLILLLAQMAQQMPYPDRYKEPLVTFLVYATFASTTMVVVLLFFSFSAFREIEFEDIPIVVVAAIAAASLKRSLYVKV